MAENNLSEKLFLETKQLRKSIARVKTCLTVGILGIIIVFFILILNLFRNFDTENFSRCLSAEMKTLTPKFSKTAVEIIREALPVYQSAFSEEFEKKLPDIKKDIEREALAFSKYMSTNVPRVLERDVGLLLERAKVKIFRECPELLDEKKIVTAFANIESAFKEKSQEIVTTGIFSQQANLLRSIYDTIHEGFPTRKSGETPDELAKRLFNLLGRIIEYEFFVDRIKEKEQEKGKKRK